MLVHLWEAIIVEFFGWRFCDPRLTGSSQGSKVRPRKYCLWDWWAQPSLGSREEVASLLAGALSLCKGTRTPAAWMQEVRKGQRLAYCFWLFTPGCQNIQGLIAKSYRLLKHSSGWFHSWYKNYCTDGLFRHLVSPREIKRIQHE